jgi:plastocyanin
MLALVGRAGMEPRLQWTDWRQNGTERSGRTPPVVRNPMHRMIVLLTLLLVAGCLAACSSNNSPSPMPSPSPVTSPTPSSGMTVSIVRGAATLTTTAYSPNPLSIPVGTTLTWTNNDTTAHTTTADAGLWSSGVLQPGAQFSFTFSSPGTFPYHCSIHPNMVGTITVM